MMLKYNLADKMFENRKLWRIFGPKGVIKS